ncbi:MAG: hypothetical protein KTR32_20290 [Granulosicoccus sp.]|nr:hypothetical protein [Granulosicoccus sp.]
MSIDWTDKQRALLVEMLDYLVPANTQRGITSAGESGVLEFIELRAVDDAELFRQINELLHQAESSADTLSEQMMHALQRKAPDAFTALLRATYMGYYSRAQSRAQLGLSAAPTQPLGYSVPSEAPEFIDALVAPVKRRGPCYRDC